MSNRSSKEQHVEVNVEIERTAEPLDQSDRTGAGCCFVEPAFLTRAA